MKTNNTAASLHALCVAANEIVQDFDKFIKSFAFRDYFQEDINNCLERLENIDGYACDRINAGRPNALVVRLTRGCEELLREFFSKVEDVAMEEDDEIYASLCEQEDTIEGLRDEDYAGVEEDIEWAEDELDCINDDIVLCDIILDSYLTLCLA